jgi:sugar/nucleoside kinase (ribokinase family)
MGNRYLLDEVRITAAGTAGGTSVDLAKLGAAVTAIGAIGDDDLAPLLLARLQHYGVDTTRLARKPGGTSATMLPICGDGERFATFHRPGVSRTLELADVDLDAVADAQLLHVGGPDVLGAFAQEPLVGVLRHARAHGTVTTIDVLSWCDAETLDRLAPAFALADYVFPNQNQLATMTGCEDPAAGARVLLELGAGCVIVTRGAAGCLVMSATDRVELPAFPVPIVDTTGCGDAFVAGFIVATLNGWDLRRRALLGSACASLVAQGLGSDAGIMDLEATLAFLRERVPDGAPA